ncbi:hypothetical protein SH501x_000289 [Pirellulaceae bacterium SH501]
MSDQSKALLGKKMWGKKIQKTSWDALIFLPSIFLPLSNRLKLEPLREPLAALALAAVFDCHPKRS